MAEIFDPVVKPIIELVAEQIRGASDTDHRVSVSINFPTPSLSIILTAENRKLCWLAGLENHNTYGRN